MERDKTYTERLLALDMTDNEATLIAEADIPWLVTGKVEPENILPDKDYLIRAIPFGHEQQVPRLLTIRFALAPESSRIKYTFAVRGIPGVSDGIQYGGACDRILADERMFWEIESQEQPVPDISPYQRVAELVRSTWCAPENP